MRVLAVLFLIAVIAFQGFVKSGIVAYYKINQEYITSTLCENKSKPSLSCNGKCFLKKKIKDQEKQESKPLSVVKGMKDSIDFCSTFLSFAFSSILSIDKNELTNYQLTFYSSPNREINQPPC